MSGTLTRADLTESVFQAVGLSRTDSAQMVEDRDHHGPTRIAAAPGRPGVI